MSSRRFAGSLPGSGHRTVVSDLVHEGGALALLEAAGELDVLVANAALPASGKLDHYSQDTSTARCGSTSRYRSRWRASS